MKVTLHGTSAVAQHCDLAVSMIGPDLLWSKDRDTGGQAVEAPWDGQGATTLMADLEASGAGTMRGGERSRRRSFFPGKGDEAIAAYLCPPAAADQPREPAGLRPPRR